MILLDFPMTTFSLPAFKSTLDWQIILIIKSATPFKDTLALIVEIDSDLGTV